MTLHLLSPDVPDALAENVITEVKIGKRVICLLRREGTLYAFAASCPHAGARMCEGFTDAKGSVVCPAHGFRFDPRNGYNRSGEGYKLRTYPIETAEDGGMRVLLPED